MDLRQFGLLLLVSREDQIPIFHKLYRGNVSDRAVFKLPIPLKPYTRSEAFRTVVPMEAVHAFRGMMYTSKRRSEATLGILILSHS